MITLSEEDILEGNLTRIKTDFTNTTCMKCDDRSGCWYKRGKSVCYLTGGKMRDKYGSGLLPE
jgi:hypothetical protein